MEEGTLVVQAESIHVENATEGVVVSICEYETTRLEYITLKHMMHFFDVRTMLCKWTHACSNG
jgi:hypothetical protein